MATQKNLSKALRGAGAIANIAGAVGLPFAGMVGTALKTGGELLKKEEPPKYVMKALQDIESKYANICKDLEILSSNSKVQKAMPASDHAAIIEAQNAMINNFVTMKADVVKVITDSARVSADALSQNAACPKIRGNLIVMEAQMQKLTSALQANGEGLADVKNAIKNCFTNIKTEIQDNLAEVTASVAMEGQKVRDNVKEVTQILAAKVDDMATQYKAMKSDLEKIVNLATDSFELIKEMHYLDGLDYIDSAHTVFFTSKQSMDQRMSQFESHRFELQTKYTQHLNPRKIGRFLNLLKDEGTGDEGHQKALAMFNYIVTVEAKYLQMMCVCHINNEDYESLTGQYDLFTDHFQQLSKVMYPILELDQLVTKDGLKNVTAFQKMVADGDVIKTQKILQFVPKDVLNKAEGEDSQFSDCTPLFLACKSGSLQMTRMLTKAGADVSMPARRKAGGQLSPLDVAAQGGHATIVEHLLQQGATVGPCDDILWEACLQGRDQILRLLTSAGAKLDLGVDRSSGGEFAHDGFQYYGVTRLIMLILLRKTGALGALSQFVSPDMARQAALGRQSLETAEAHLTAAWLAAESGDSATLALLIKLGAPVDATAVSKEGNHLSCLQVASEKGHMDTLNLLLKSGAQVNNGKNCLLEPSRQGRLDVVSVLLEAGEDPAVPGASWESPLLLAKRGGHKEIVTILSRYKKEVSFFFPSWLKGTFLDKPIEQFCEFYMPENFFLGPGASDAEGKTSPQPAGVKTKGY